MQCFTTLRAKITFRVALIIVAIGSLVCAILIGHEYAKSRRQFNNDVHNGTSLLAELIVRDVTVGNYYAVRAKLLDYAKYKGINSLVLCLENNESIEVVNREGIKPIRCNSPNDAGGSEVIARSSLTHEGAPFGMLIVAYPKEIMSGQVRNLMRAIIISFAVILTIAIAMLHYATRSTLHPIVSYIAWMKNIADSREISRDILLRNDDIRSREEGDLRQAFAFVLDRYVKAQERRREETLMAAIGRIASQLAHDIRSPLSVLKSYVGAVHDAALPKHEFEEGRGAAWRSLEKLQNMTEDLLDYAKAQKVQMATASIDEMVKSVLREVSQEAATHGVTVRHEGVTGIVADIDRHKIDRVLTNIVLNGIQAHDHAGSVSIKTESDRNNLMFSITDDGKGIPSENHEKVFDRSFTFGKPRGTGLGLAYCKQVVDAHGGEIGVESELGKGSTFTIRIPNGIVKGQDIQKDRGRYVCAAAPAAGTTK